MVNRIKVEIPDAFRFLFEPCRYKVAYGGRGSGKSTACADALLLQGAQKPLRIGCFREIQNSIAQSVHKLLSDRTKILGLDSFYNVTDRTITGKNGTEFIFTGLFRNVNQIKSMEGIDRAYVEEAESVSDESWDLLIPTIRKPDSEIWVVFNPRYEEDATYRRFVVNPPVTSIIREINFDQNPFFPDVLRHEMDQDRARDKAKYETIWMGKPRGGGRRLWSAFAREHHLRDIDMTFIARYGNCYMAMDPHSHYYPFCVWVAILPKNDRRQGPEDFYRHVYAEYPTIEDIGGPYHELRKKLMYTGTLADMSRDIQARDGSEFGIKIRDRYIDSRYAKGAGSWSWSSSTDGVVEQFAKRENGGILFRLPNEKRMDAQKQIIHADMLWNPSISRGPFNEPSFSISPRCKNLISSLINHRLEEESDKEDERYKDPSDALRICWAGLEKESYEDPSGKPRTNFSGQSQFTFSLGIV
jgi:hypothetical protein